MEKAINIVQIVVSSVLIVLILLQARGTGLGRTFGGGGGTSFSRRGLERLIFKLTFVVVFFFLAISTLTIIY